VNIIIKNESDISDVGVVGMVQAVMRGKPRSGQLTQFRVAQFPGKVLIVNVCYTESEDGESLFHIASKDADKK